MAQDKKQLMRQTMRNTKFLAGCKEIQTDFIAIDADETLTTKITAALTYQLDD